MYVRTYAHTHTYVYIYLHEFILYVALHAYLSSSGTFKFLASILRPNFARTIKTAIIRMITKAATMAITTPITMFVTFMPPIK